MKKTLFLSVFGILLFQFLKAEPPVQVGSIQGKIYDSKSSEELVGVNILVGNSNIGTATDGKGEFYLNGLKTGKTELIFSMIGYEPQKKMVDIKPGNSLEVDIYLKKTLLKMGSVVVTGTGTQHILQEAPVKTNLITRLDIEQKKAVNVAEALNFQPGINVENNCQNCNFSQVRILGMDGKYSQILINGDPVVSSLAGIYGLEQYPAEMLDRLEVIKGGGSALYGAGAVAGVINLITRTPKVPQSIVKISEQVTDEGTSDYHVGISSEVVSRSGNAGAYIFASARNRDHYDRNDDGYSELGELQNESLGFNMYLNPTENGVLSTHIHRIHENRRGGNKFSKPYHDADITEALEHWKWGGTVKWTHRLTPLFDYKTFYSFALTDRKSYYGGLAGGRTLEDSLAAMKAYGTTKNPLQIFGATANYMLGNHLITNGIQYSQDKIDDKSTSNEDYYIDKTFSNFGYFIQDNIHFGDNQKLEIVIGTRIDKHSELDDLVFSPRLNVKYDLTDEHVFRAGYSTGFKAPQVFDEDLHIGVLGGDQKVLRNSDDLKEENSQSITAGIDYNGYVGDVGVMYGVTGYYTILSDAFGERFVKSENNVNIWERINSDGATVQGLELEIGIQPTAKYEIIGGISLSEGKYDEKQEDWNTKNFLRTPKFSGNLSLSAQFTKNLNMAIRAKYMGKSDMPHEIPVDGQDEPDLKLETSDSFTRVDVLFSYKRFIMKGVNTKLTLGVKNITDAYQKDLDKGADRDPAYVYGPSLPRSFFFGLETNF